MRDRDAVWYADVYIVYGEWRESRLKKKERPQYLFVKMHLIPPNTVCVTTYVVALADPRDIVGPSIVLPFVGVIQIWFIL